MFNKNSFIKLEVLPDGHHLITTNINKNTNTESFVELINNFLSREYLDAMLDLIMEKANKNKCLSIGKEICHEVVYVQNQLEIKPIHTCKRNPIIRPSQVIKDEIDNE